MKGVVFLFVVILSSTDLAGQYFRLNTILNEQNTLQNISSDRYTYFFDGNYLNSYQNQNTTFYIDGHRISSSILGTPLINTIPINSVNIDSVIFLNSFFQNTYAQSGGIIFYITEPQKKMSLLANIREGNEVDDPEPYKYTEYGTVNIDGIGNESFFSISSQMNKFSFNTGLHYQRHSYTDQNISNRIYSQLNTGLFLVSYRYNPFAMIRFNTESSSNSILATYSRKELYPLFIPSYGGEVPVDVSQFIISEHGNYTFENKNRIEYKFSFNQDILSENKYARNFVPDWNSQNVLSEVGYTVIDTNHRLKVGVSSDLFRIQNDSIDTNSLDVQSIFLENTSLIDGKFSLNTIFRLKNSVSGTGLVLASGFETLTKTKFSFEAEWAQILPEENRSFYSWLNRGYEPSGGHPDAFENASLISIGSIRTTNRSSFNASLKNIGLGSALLIESAFALRFWENIYLNNNTYRIGPSSRLLPQNLTSDNENGSVFGANIKLIHQLSNPVKHSIQFSNLLILNGTDSFKNEWEKNPPALINYLLDIKPDESLELKASYHFQKAGFWKEFEGLDERTSRDYSQPKNYHLINLYIRQYFFDRRFKITVALENILNQKIKNHPLGTINNMSLFFELGLEL